ncbi:MAG: hypothetical protein CFE26_18485, partial [Verrucomicrobiales bacterium VVV1]
MLIRCGLGVGLLLVTLSLVIYNHVSKSLARELNRAVRGTASLLADQIELEDGRIIYEWREGIRPKAVLPGGELFQYWDESKGTSVRSPGMNENDLPRFTGPEGAPEFQNIILPDGSRARALGLRVYPYVLAEEVEKMKARGAVLDPRKFPHILVAAQSAESNFRTLERLASVLIIGNLCTLGLGFLVIDRVIRATLRPIDQLAAQVVNRAEHQLDDALEVPGGLPSELVGLANGFDALLSRVAATRKRERDFIRYAAHELRTPIAGLRATTDLALSRKRLADDYETYLETCHLAAMQLGGLVQRLSSLARTGRSIDASQFERVDLAVVFHDCLRAHFARAREQGLLIEDDVPLEGLLVSGDRPMIRLILNNLLDNAVTYGRRGAGIRILACGNEEWIEMRFINGVEVMPSDLERLFEPLFRQ